MADKIKLVCSQKPSSNDVSALKDIFRSRFRLSDEFWKDLFHHRCPEGLGEVNEKLQNYENVSPNDFDQSYESASSHHEDSHDDTEGECGQKVADFKTPLAKCSANISQSPSLFSPAPQEHINNNERGPDCSTPLPGIPIGSSSRFDVSASTPIPRRNVSNSSCKTPVTTLLRQTFTSTKSTTPKLSRTLSATLEMDPSDFMNLSWTSSLATPPDKEEILRGEIVEGQDGASSEISDGGGTVPGVMQHKKRSSKGVARVLFEKKMGGTEQVPVATETSIGDFQPLGSSTLDSETMQKSKDEISNRTTGSSNQNRTVDAGEYSRTTETENNSKTLGKAEYKTEPNIGSPVANNNDVDYFDVSPLHGSVVQAMMELSPMAETHKPWLTEANDISDVNQRSGKSPTLLQTADNGQVEIKSHYTTDNLKHVEDFYDMDALSEFPIDYEFPEDVKIVLSDTKKNKLNGHGAGPQYSVHMSDCSNEMAPICRGESRQLLTDSKNKAEAIEKESSKKLPEETFGTRTRNKDNIMISGSNVVEGEKCIPRKMETASQILRDLSQENLSDIPYDDGDISNLLLLQKTKSSEDHDHHDGIVNTKCNVEINKKGALNGKMVIANRQNCVNTLRKLEERIPVEKQLLAENLGDKTSKNEEASQKSHGRMGNFVEKMENIRDKENKCNDDDVNPDDVNVGCDSDHDKNTYVIERNIEIPTELVENRMILEEISTCVSRDYNTHNSTTDRNECSRITNASNKEVSTTGKSVHAHEVLKQPDSDEKDTKEDVVIEEKKAKELFKSVDVPCKNIITENKDHEWENSMDIDWEMVEALGLGCPPSTISAEKPTNCEGSSKTMKVVDGVAMGEDQKPGVKSDEADNTKFHHTSDNDNFSVGFSTASVKKVDISEQSLEKARKNMKHVCNDEDNNVCIGFSTASGKKVNISDDSLNKARAMLKDLEDKDDFMGYSNVKIPKDSSKETKSINLENINGVFSTASGKKVDISEKSRERARAIMNDVDQHENFGRKRNGEFLTPNLPIGRRSISRSVFSAASGKNVEASEQFLEKAGTLMNDVAEDGKFSRNGGILTPRLFDEVPRQSYIGDNLNSVFSTASGKKVNVSEKSLEKVRVLMDDVDKDAEFMRKNNDGFLTPKCPTDLSRQHGRSVGGNLFSTACGKKVNISDKSLEKARAIMNDVKNDEKRAAKKSDGVSIPNLSEESFEKARPGVNNHVGGLSVYSTGSRKKVDKSLDRARAIVNDVNKDETCKGKSKTEPTPKNSEQAFRQRSVNSIVDVLSVFSTASGKNVDVFDSSLVRATEIMNDTNKDDTFQNNDGFPTPRSCDESSCQRVNENRYSLPMFFTGSGKNVDISDQSLVKARALMNDIDNDVKSKENNCTSSPKRPEFLSKQADRQEFNVFSTASGKKVDISGKYLEEARTMMNDFDKDEDWVSTSKHSLERSRGRTRTSNSVFSTASGRKVNIADEFLEKARAMMNDVDEDEEIGKRNERDRNQVDRNEGNYQKRENDNLKNRRSCFEQTQRDSHNAGRIHRNGCQEADRFGTGFSTASGRKVDISDESLEKARQILEQVDNAAEGAAGEVNKISYNEPKAVNGKNDCFGFTTASGKNVAVSEESLTKAREILENVDTDCEANNLESPSDVLSKSITDRKNEPCVKSLSSFQQFSATSEKDINVSDTCLKKSRNTLNQDEAVPHTNCMEDKRNAVFSLPDQKAPDFRHLDSVITSKERSYEGKTCVEHNKMCVTVQTSDMASHSHVLCSTGVNFDHMSQMTRQEISESSNMLLFDESFMDLSQLIGTSISNQEKESSNGETRTKSTLKRQSPEMESDYVRPCKSLRTENNGSEKLQGQVPPKKHEDSRSVMKPYNSNPIEFHCDRQYYSELRSPMKASPDNNQLKSRNRSGKAGLIVTPRSRKSSSDKRQLNHSCKSTSRFTTPYRISGCYDNNDKPEKSVLPNRTCSNKEVKGSEHSEKNAGKNGQSHSTKPQIGSIYKSRTSPNLKRIPLSSYVENGCETWTSSELFERGLHPSVLSIRCENAESYRFNGCDFMSEKVCQNNSGVRCTDGAVLFLGEDKCCGVEEFENAFLGSPGVDSNLISKQWIANHYRWIIWKLASYEVTYPAFLGRCLTSDMVLRQLKYRYDREIDRCERSAIKKILERDDTPSRGMVLCVADMNVPTLDTQVNDESKRPTNTIKPQLILMTDGWYLVRVLLDEYLQSLVSCGKIFTGQKLYTQGAELVGSDQAVSPLEAPCNLHLKIHGNSTRPATAFARLGFHCLNNAFTVPISSLSSGGGLVSCIKVIVARQYPLQFMEKLSDGSCVFRNPRCEERVAKLFEKQIQRKREKTMYQVQVELEKEEETQNTTACKKRKKNALSLEKIQKLCDGKELFDAINNVDDPSSVQHTLSEEQKRVLDHYKVTFHDNKATSMRRKYEEAWQKLHEQESLERNVVPVLKVKLVDISPQKNNKIPATALLTIWRPTEHVITILGEGKCLKIYNIYASRKYARGSNHVELTANRSSIYKELPFEPNYQEIFHARKVYNIDDLSNGIKPGVEVDVVAVVISYTAQPSLAVIYMADADLNIVQLKIWRGLQEQALEDIVKENAFVATSNLIFQPDKRCGIPSLKYYELSVITTNPSNKILRNKLRDLKKAVQNPTTFVTQAKARLNELLSCTSSITPRVKPCERMYTTPVNTISTPAQATSESSAKVNESTSGSLKQSRKRLLQLKRRKLDLLPTPPPLSPLLNAVPSSVRKEFKVPRRIITQSKENNVDESEMN